MHTSELEIKAIAKAVGGSLSRNGHNVPHTAILNAISAALDKRDWQTLKASLSARAQLEEPSSATPRNPLVVELQGPEVSADFWTDDHAFEATFDARTYLMQASTRQLRSIIEVGYRGDYATDEIAEFCAISEEGIKEGFAYIYALQRAGSSVVRDIGFECSINPRELLTWMAECRAPELASMLCERQGVDIWQSTDKEDSGMWCWCQPTPCNLACDYSYETKSAAEIGAYETLTLLADEIETIFPY